jgi:glycosyltransferase involved in cell wall biosynthesis
MQRDFFRLKRLGIIHELNIKTRRPIHDISTIERYAAQHANHIIATSNIVKQDLIEEDISPKKIEVIHNAIEDYWFETPNTQPNNKPSLVFLGRIGEDAFTKKLKGLDRLICLFEKFPKIEKLSIIMSRNKKLAQWMQDSIPNNSVSLNALKNTIPAMLQKHTGGIALIPSRYEGFSLSLAEAMSQGLVPVSFPVGIAPEVIRNGENGFVVHTLAEAEEKIALLIKNTALRHRLSLNARETAKQFRADIMIKRMLALYKKILK